MARKVGVVASVGAARAITGTLGALKALDQQGLKLGREIVAIEGASGGGIAAPTAAALGIDEAIRKLSSVKLEDFVHRVRLWEGETKFQKFFSYAKFLTWDQFRRGRYAYDGDGSRLMGTLKKWCLEAGVRTMSDIPVRTELIAFEVSPRPGKQRFNQWLTPDVPPWIAMAATANMAVTWKVRYRSREGVVHHYKDGGATDEIPLDEAYDWMPYDQIIFRDWFAGDIIEGRVPGPGVDEIIVITPLNTRDPQKRDTVDDLDDERFAFYKMFGNALRGILSEQWEDNLDPYFRSYLNPNVKIRLLPIRGLFASLGRPEQWGDQIEEARKIALKEIATWD